MLRTRLTAGRPCREGQVAGLPSTRVRCSGRHIVNDDPPQGEMPIGSHLCLIKKKCDLWDSSDYTFRAAGAIFFSVGAVRNYTVGSYIEVHNRLWRKLHVQSSWQNFLSNTSALLWLL